MIHLKRSIHSPIKRFRTDILIDEQIKYIRQYEYELISRHLESKIINLDDHRATFDYLTRITGDEFDYAVKSKCSNRPVSCTDLNLECEWDEMQENQVEQREQIETVDEIDIIFQSNEDLVKNYYRNLIRLNVVKKFNIELEYHRKLLEIAVRTQVNLNELRSKVEWLENEIEQIILSNRNIKFPMQRKLLNDPNLKVTKIDKSLLIKPVVATPEPEIVEEVQQPLEEMTADQQEMNKIANLLSMWDKKSASSEITISDAASSNHQDLIDETYKLEVEEKENDKESVEEKVMEEPVEAQNVDNLEIQRETTIMIEQQVPIVDDDLELEEEELEIEENDDQQPAIEPIMEEETSVPFYLLPHNRFEYPEYSKKMVALNFNSYHRLGLSLTDTYVYDENKIDGRVPTIEKKTFPDLNDTRLMSLASRIEEIYRAICKSTDQFKPVNLPALTSNSKADRMLSAMSIASSKRFKSVQVVPKQSLACRPKTFEPQHIASRQIPLPQSKKNLNHFYPRDPLVYSLSAPQHRNFRYPPRLVNQHNLKEQTKFKLYFPNELNIKELKTEVSTDENKREELSKIPDYFEWQQIKPDTDSGLKLEKIRTLLNVDLKSKVLEQKRDAIKHIGLLKIGDHGVIFALNNLLLNDTEHELIKFETSKSLVLLGDWNENVCLSFIRYLKHGNWNVRKELMNTIINSKNTQFNKEMPTVRFLAGILERFTIVKFDERISLNASICVGKLGFKSSRKSLIRLYSIVDDENTSSDYWYLKTLALEALVKHFDKKDDKTIQSILYQIENSPLWISRTSAMQLLAFLGPNVVCKSSLIEKVYKLLETRLSDDPIWEVRLEVGNTIKELQLFEKVFARMSKNLENTDPDLRGKAVIAMEMLGVKKTKVLHTLIDMLELDNNEHVRTLVLKALFSLAPNNPKVLFAFNSLEKNSRIYQVFCKLRDQKNKSKLLNKREIKSF